MIASLQLRIRAWSHASPISILHTQYYAVKHILKIWICVFPNMNQNHNEPWSLKRNLLAQPTHTHALLSEQGIQRDTTQRGPHTQTQPKEDLTLSFTQVVYQHTSNKISEKTSLLSTFSVPFLAPGVQIVFSQFSTSLVYNLFYSVEFPVMSCHISPRMAHCL